MFKDRSYKSTKTHKQASNSCFDRKSRKKYLKKNRQTLKKIQMTRKMSHKSKTFINQTALDIN